MTSYNDAPSKWVLAQRTNPPPPEMPSPGGAHEDDPSDMDDFEDELMDVHVEHMPEMDDEDEYVVTQGPTALWQCHIVRTSSVQFSFEQQLY